LTHIIQMSVLLKVGSAFQASNRFFIQKQDQFEITAFWENFFAILTTILLNK